MSANPSTHDIPNGVGLRGQKYKKYTIINTCILFKNEIMVFVTIYGLVNPVHNETSDKKEMEMILQRFLHVERTEKRRLSLISVHLLLN